MTNVAIVGAGAGGTSILKLLQGITDIKIIGMCDLDEHAQGIVLARNLGIDTYNDIRKVLALPALDILIEVTGVPKVQELIGQYKSEQPPGRKYQPIKHPEQTYILCNAKTCLFHIELLVI